MLTVSFNNTPRQLPEPMNLHDALREWEISGEQFAIAVNGEFVPRSRYADCVLQDRDQIDLVKPVGGG